MTLEQQLQYLEERSEASASTLPQLKRCKVWKLQPTYAYPSVRIDGKTYRVQRFAWAVYNGGVEQLSDGYIIYSTCGNSRCIAKEHLKVRVNSRRLLKKDETETPAVSAFKGLQVSKLDAEASEAARAFMLPDGFEALAQVVEKAQATEATGRTYGVGVRHFFRWCVANDMPKLNRATVMQYRESVKGALTPATVNNRLAAIRALARECLHAQLLTRDECEAIEKVKGVKDFVHEDGSTGAAHRKRWLTVGEVQKLLSLDLGIQANRRLKARALLRLYCTTGLRLEEACSLQWSQLVQLDGRAVFENVVTKGRKVRTVPVAGETLKALMEWKSSSAKALETAAESSVDASSVFGLTKSGAYAIVAEASAAMGFRFTPHDLRRSFAKIMSDRGRTLQDIQRSLGHARPQTTMTYIGDQTNWSSTLADDMDSLLMTPEGAGEPK